MKSWSQLNQQKPFWIATQINQLPLVDCVSATKKPLDFGDWGSFTPISGVMGRWRRGLPCSFRGEWRDGRGGVQSCRSNGWFRTFEGSKNFMPSLLDVKLAKFETWDTYILERKYLKIRNKNMLRAIFT